MKKILFIAIIIFGFIKTFSQILPDGFSTDSNLIARKVLEASIEAYGGKNALKKTRNFSMKINGVNYNLFQDESPKTKDFEAWISEATIVYQADKQRLYNDRKVSDVNSPYYWQARQVIRNGEGFDIIVQENWIMKMRDASIENYPQILQLFPQNIVSDAWGKNSSLRFLGETTVEKRKQNVVFSRLSTGQMLNLFFDSETKLLTKIDWFFTYNVWGDTLEEIYFKGYHSFEGTMIPSHRIGYRNKVIRYENNYVDVKFNPQVDDSLFEINPKMIKLNTVEQKTEVIKLADRVYLIRALAGGFNVMFVEFKDFVIAVESPEENIVNGISSESVAYIKKTIPGKPIKYVIPTHHHGDHSSGMRTFMAEGATVITTKGNIDYVDRLAKAKFTYAPDAYANNPIPYQIKTVENNKMIISDESQTVEIHQFSPLTHAKEMLLVYLPKNKILYQSDMFNPIDMNDNAIPEDDPWHGINQANTIDLFDTINKLRLKVERIAGSHGRIATIKEFTDAVGRIKAKK